jgi:hypothetical protein
MKSLTLRGSRSATPVNPISTKSFYTAEGIDNPESKVPMIRQNSSLTVWKEKLPMVRKTSALEVYKPNFPQYIKEDSALETQEKNSLTLISEYKAEIEENSNADEITFKNKIAVMLNIFLYGTPPKFKTEHEKNYYYRSLAFFASIASRISAEQDFDSSPENRFISCFDEDLKVKRYDKKPEDKIMWRNDPNNSKKILKGPQDEKIYQYILTCFSKSFLDTQGKIIPVNNLSLDIFTEFFPNELANFVYKHVADTNKAVVQRGYEIDSDPEHVSLNRSNMLSELERMEKRASPLTSASHNATRPELFMAWGKPGEHKEIDTAKVRILSTSQIVNLILFAANDEHAYKEAKFGNGSKFNWREHDKHLWNEKSLKDTEKALIEHGIDPNGDWTEREKTAYYTLIAGEWLVLGATQKDVARIIYESE